MAQPNQLPRNDDPTELEPRPRPASDRGPDSTTAQLKQDIDSGVAGDKTAVIDVGMANLGTGAEASGFPMTPEMIEMDRKNQRMQAAPHGDPGRRMGIGKGAIVAGVLSGLVLLGLLAVFLG